MFMIRSYNFINIAQAVVCTGKTIMIEIAKPVMMNIQPNQCGYKTRIHRNKQYRITTRNQNSKKQENVAFMQFNINKAHKAQ